MAKSYEMKETRHPSLCRVVDREGNWDHYYLKLPGMEEGVYLRGVTGIIDRGYAKGNGLLKFLSQHTEIQRDEILKSAGGKGDKVHRAIDIISSGETKIERDTGIFNRHTGDYDRLSNAEWDALLSWVRFWQEHIPVIFSHESPVFSMKGGYAGTSDVFWMLTKECDSKKCPCHKIIGKVGLNDYKTAKGIYPSYWSQIAAYASADNVAEYIPKGAKVEYLSVLRLGTDHKNGGYEFQVETGDERKRSLTRFNAAKAIDDYDYKPFDPGKIEEIPDVIEVKVDRLDPKEELVKPKKLKKKKA